MVPITPIGQPANESERRAIGFLRNHLPAGWWIFHNFESLQSVEVFEINIAILAHRAVYLVDIKGMGGGGNIEMRGSDWYRKGQYLSLRH